MHTETPISNLLAHTPSPLAGEGWDGGEKHGMGTPPAATPTLTLIGARLSSKNLSQKHLCCPLSLWERARVRGPEAFRWDIKPLTPTLSQGRGSWKALCHKP